MNIANKSIALFSALALLSTASVAENITIERIFSSPSLHGKQPNQLKISPDGKRVTFIQGKTNDYERYDLWQYEIDSGKTSILFDADDLHKGPENLSDEEKARRERQRINGSGILEYTWSKDGKSLLFPLGGDAYFYSLDSGEVKRLLETEEFETDIKLSPQGNYISFIRNQNIFIKNIASGKEKRLTKDGGGAIKNGMAEFAAQEEMGRLTGYWWSPDESHIAYTRVDESPVHEITRSEIYAEKIDLIQQRYPSAGTPNVKIQLGVKSIKSRKTQWIDLGDNEDIYIPRVNWATDASTLTYQWQSRDQQTLSLNRYDIQTKKQSVLLTEQSDTWVNLHDDLYFLNDTEHFLWASERDGFKHLYLYKMDGTLVKQVTQGEWVVDEVKSIDEKNNVVYFTGRVDTPIERHLYKATLKSSSPLDTPIQRLSQRSGFHEINFSKDGSVYIDRFSTANTPNQVSLHNSLGDHLTWLEENAIDDSHPLNDFQDNWIAPTFGTLKTADNATLHYRLYTPKNIQEKRPAIVYLYGGPHAQLVTNSWGGSRGLITQYWVNKGYVVFTIDNRGSANRGTEFENPIFEKMGSIEVQDQVEGVKFLRTLSYVDSDKVGVYGHSYGGYMSLMSMFKAGDYFTAGVSGAPVTDWALYDTHYTERYMGDPTKNVEQYEASSVFPYAKDLKGPLLIYHGMADDNVLFTHSTKLFKHLQDNALPFEVMTYPGKKHGIRGKQTSIHLYSLITDFFDKHFN